jgi:hypothetical protein
MARYRQLCPVSFNLDEQWVNGIFEYVQSLLETCIGVGLVAELLLQITNNTLTPANIALMQYVEKVFSWSLYSESCVYVANRMENKGMVNNLDSSSSQMSSNAVNMMRLDSLKKHEHWKEKMINFLNQNYLQYPLYPYQSTCDSGVCSNKYPLFVR